MLWVLIRSAKALLMSTHNWFSHRNKKNILFSEATLYCTSNCVSTGLTTGTSYTKNFVRSAKLLHWNGHFKPWGRRSQHADLWDKYFIQDPTGEFEPVRRN